MPIWQGWLLLTYPTLRFVIGLFTPSLPERDRGHHHHPIVVAAPAIMGFIKLYDCLLSQAQHLLLMQCHLMGI